MHQEEKHDRANYLELILQLSIFKEWNLIHSKAKLNQRLCYSVQRFDISFEKGQHRGGRQPEAAACFVARKMRKILLWWKKAGAAQSKQFQWKEIKLALAGNASHCGFERRHEQALKLTLMSFSLQVPKLLFVRIFSFTKSKVFPIHSWFIDVDWRASGWPLSAFPQTSYLSFLLQM